MNATFETPERVTKWGTAKGLKPKILLVDDDAGMRRVLFQMLVKEDFCVLTAPNGARALELANVTKFDLVLLDFKKPV